MEELIWHNVIIELPPEGKLVLIKSLSYHAICKHLFISSMLIKGEWLTERKIPIVHLGFKPIAWAYLDHDQADCKQEEITK